MHPSTRTVRWGAVIGMAALLAVSAVALPAFAGTSSAASVAAYWTPERMAAATPRDLVVDQHGQGYLRRADGTLEPHGSGTSPTPAAKPASPGGGGGGSDTTAPTIGAMTPDGSSPVTSSPHTFSATVSDDASGVKSVTFHLTPSGGTPSSHAATLSSGDSLAGTWTAGIDLTDGEWSWTVEARDNGKRGGNVDTSDAVTFTVDTGTSGGDEPPAGTVTDADWPETTATAQTATGRLYFEMPDRGPFWVGYVCSGTVATDSADLRSVIITAAHCVYDEDKDVFARRVLFIPNQDASSSKTNTDCNDDPLGCWVPTHGVVDSDWATRSWPDNIPWDYGYYVVPTTGSHQGTGTDTDSLEVEAGSLLPQFTGAAHTHTYALGYSYSQDPHLRYCAEDVTTGSSYGGLWLGSCGLSGGASGGPWMQSAGEGPIISVNSYGYSNQPGMGGPLLTGSARCMFAEAQTATTLTTDRGLVSTCSP